MQMLLKKVKGNKEEGAVNDKETAGLGFDKAKV